MRGLVRYQLKDPTWGEFTIYRPIPKDGELWGCLASLKGTEWEKTIPVVSGANLSHALHGFIAPLIKEIGPEPRLLAKQVGQTQGRCALYKTCIAAEPSCNPAGPPPDCYEAPMEDYGASFAATTVVLCWKTGGWVVVVGEGEFSL